MKKTMICLLQKKRRNNLGKRRMGDMGYGMAMVADLLGHDDGVVDVVMTETTMMLLKSLARHH